MNNYTTVYIHHCEAESAKEAVAKMKASVFHTGNTINVYRNGDPDPIHVDIGNIQVIQDRSARLSLSGRVAGRPQGSS